LFVLFCFLFVFILRFYSTEDSMDAKPSPSSDSRTSTPEPKTIFKDKREALEAFKELLREKVIFI
jgi:hypothetical protein